MDLPNDDTLKIIEERKKYLIKKSEKDPEKNGYLIPEIKALDKVINLINLFQNVPSEFKREFADKNIKKVSEEESDNDYTVLQSFEQEITKNSILEIEHIEMKNTSRKFIILVLKVYKEKLLKWVYQGKIRLTVGVLEKILNQIKQ